MTITASLWCETCEKEIETEATHESFTDSVSYTCPKCKTQNSEANWVSV